MARLLKSVLRNLFSRPATRPYPKVVRPAAAGVRGNLLIDIERCIFCGLCVRRCPAAALKVVRDPKSWTLDPYRCIVCGYCVEVCPTKCLRLDPEHFKPHA